MRDGALIFHTEGVFSYPGYGRMLVARVILSLRRAESMDLQTKAIIWSER